MLISERMNAALNQQIANEFGASLMYVAVAAYFDSDSLLELASHFYAQAAEERDHAMKFVKYVVDAGGQLEIAAIPPASSSYASAEAAVQAVLNAELEVTRQINELADLARQESDHLSQTFLNWFITEQMEEVSTSSTLLRVVQRAGDNLLLAEDYIARHKVSGPAPAAAS